MAIPRARTVPHPGEIWLSCPPYLLVARILAVDEGGSAPVVSYSLHDESGYALERVTHAELDDGWWQAFQPLVARYG